MHGRAGVAGHLRRLLCNPALSLLHRPPPQLHMRFHHKPLMNNACRTPPPNTHTPEKTRACWWAHKSEPWLKMGENPKRILAEPRFGCLRKEDRSLERSP